MGCISSSALKSAQFDEKKQFSFQHLTVKAKVVYVYDGDTIYLQFFYQQRIIQLCVRMLGYDSPEMIPRRNLPHREEEIKKAILARNRLVYLVSGVTLKEDQKYTKDELKVILAQSNKLITVHFDTFDKYGRTLATLYDNNQSLNKKMMEEGHGYEYHGGSKKTFGKEE